MDRTILLTGGTGLVGKLLTEELVERGYQVHILTRSSRSSTKQVHYFQWDTASRQLDERCLEGIDTIIHLAGAPIAKRWTKSYRQEIIASRVDGAEILLHALRALNKPLSAFISASASGFYPPNTGQEMLETHPSADSGFLGQVCAQWEQAALESKDIAERVVIHRIGIVLSEKGGALEKMLPPFKFGVAPYFGNGQQYYSWVHIKDLVQQIIHSLEKPLAGIFNAGTDYISQKELNKAIANALHKKALALPVPKFMMNLVMGKMAAIVNDSVKMNNEKIKATNFQPQFQTIEQALEDIL